MGEVEIALGVFAILAILGIAIGVRSVKRREKVRRLFELAEMALVEGKRDEAIRLLLTAEREWSLNSHDGSRKSHLEDLKDLEAVIKRLSSIESTPNDVCTDLCARIVELREIQQDASNFGIDGRMMSSQAAQKWVAAFARFEEVRKTLRAKCNV